MGNERSTSQCGASVLLSQSPTVSTITSHASTNPASQKANSFLSILSPPSSKKIASAGTTTVILNAEPHKVSSKSETDSIAAVEKAGPR